MPKVLNMKDVQEFNQDMIYIGRPSKWGNPFIIGKDGNRKEVIQKYQEYLKNNSNLIIEVKKELKGKNLVCHCAPLKCHGDVLLQIANEDDSIEY
jgi:hypothetical protein